MREPGGNPPDLDLEFPHELRASRMVRAALRPLFAVEDRLGADVTLAVSELVTNVVSHTTQGGVLRVWLSDPIWVEVHDHSSGQPRIEPSDREGGRGLAIIAALTNGHWGVDVAGTTKVVWAEFTR